MSLRIRENGDVVCAALHPEMPGDVYLDDAQHYAISVTCRALRAVRGGRWRFVEHGTRDLSADESEHMDMSEETP
jgi:hypothetical protein